MTTKRYQEILNILSAEVKPALGCTEPTAAALAAAKAMEVFSEDSEKKIQKESLYINLYVSGNILKNGMGVGIPGTGMIGLHIAAALGAICGKSKYGLEVLKEVSAEAVECAKKMVAEDRISIILSENVPKLFVAAKVFDANDESKTYCTATIAENHDQIVKIEKNGKVLFIDDDFEVIMKNEEDSDTENDAKRKYNLSVEEIWNFANDAKMEDIKFILEMKNMNLRLAKEGITGDYGLKVGKCIRANQLSIYGDDFMSYAMGMTAAASDARMAGCTLPAMSNSGSGNQGITVSMPVITYAIKFNVEEDKLTRALILSNLIAIHIKSYLGKLSALCGCVIASTGSSCGITYLMGGKFEHICNAIKNMAGNITGMVCDGAKQGCALKVASGVASAVQSAVLALNGISANETDGIIEKDIEKTIKNIGDIGSKGMKNTDKLILNIMVKKN